MRILMVVGVSASLVWASSSFSETVYKWQAEDGSITYSTVAPTENGQVEQVEVVTEGQRTTRQSSGADPVPALLERGDRIGQAAAERRVRREELKRALAAERRVLAELKQKANDEVRPGERIAKSGGGSRLSPAYFDRLAKQEKEISEKEEQIKKLQKELKSLNR